MCGALVDSSGAAVTIDGMNAALGELLDVCNSVFSIIFAIELVLKVVALARHNYISHNYTGHNYIGHNYTPEGRGPRRAAVLRRRLQLLRRAGGNWPWLARGRGDRRP